MAVVKEYRCMVHGDFEGKKPLCPHGCDTVERIFKTPPAFRSERTANIDATVQNLAARHGMTDISNRGGAAAKRQSGAQAAQAEAMRKLIRERYGDTGWGPPPTGSKTLNVKTGKVEESPYHPGAGGSPEGAIAGFGAKPDNVLDEVTQGGTKPIPMKPVLVRRDHEKLRVEDARPPTP